MEQEGPDQAMLRELELSKTQLAAMMRYMGFVAIVESGPKELHRRRGGQTARL